MPAIRTLINMQVARIGTHISPISLLPFAAVLTSYLVMRYLVAVCPSAEYTRHTTHSSNA